MKSNRDPENKTSNLLMRIIAAIIGLCIMYIGFNMALNINADNAAYNAGYEAAVRGD